MSHGIIAAVAMTGATSLYVLCETMGYPFGMRNSSLILSCMILLPCLVFTVFTVIVHLKLENFQLQLEAVMSELLSFHLVEASLVGIRIGVGVQWNCCRSVLPSDGRKRDEESRVIAV